jgi:FtsZ-binding cell division protein ZapB
VISDSTRKENFRTTDGAVFLKKISGMGLGSWNYKGQNVKRYRHYGPMAKDFFAAFGHDELEVIGEDKSINQADFDGVNLIAIQALIREVEALKAENKNLKQAETSMKAETESLKVKMQQFEKQLSTITASGTISTLSK